MASEATRSAAGTKPRVEWQTVAVAVAVYGCWLTILALHRSTPWPLTVLSLGVVVTWHGSLQHETIHGHPFRSRRLNMMLGFLPISLRLPYHVYRFSHLLHHACPELTDPIDDTESFYVTAERWRTVGRVRRAFYLAHHTLLGRMLLGPPRQMVRILVFQAREVRRGNLRPARWWAAHAVVVAAVCVFVVAVMGLPLWQYLLGAVYLGHSFTLLRSYCEHRWVDGATRSAVVRSGRVFGLLFLYNNLHHVHHAEPGVPWYRLPALADTTGAFEKAAAGAGLYRGYGELAYRFLVRPFDHPVHPAQRALLVS